jgi:hypothetical protein
MWERRNETQMKGKETRGEEREEIKGESEHRGGR